MADEAIEASRRMEPAAMAKAAARTIEEMALADEAFQRALEATKAVAIKAAEQFAQDALRNASPVLPPVPLQPNFKAPPTSIQGRLEVRPGAGGIASPISSRHSEAAVAELTASAPAATVRVGRPEDDDELMPERPEQTERSNTEKGEAEDRGGRRPVDLQEASYEYRFNEETWFPRDFKMISWES